MTPQDPTAQGPTGSGRMTRRGLLAAAGGLLVAACGHALAHRATGSPSPVGPSTGPRPGTPGPSGGGGSPAAAGAPRVVRTGPAARRQVALTFHGAGDPRLAVQLLDEVERAGAAVTVLAVGTWLAANPSMARRILDGHHDLGNHTYTHPTLYQLGPSAIADEIDRCAALVRRLTGGPGAFFRPSGGPRITAPMVSAAGRAGYPVVLGYDVDPSDNLDPGSSVVTQRVLTAARPGSIVSLHLGHPGTVAAIPHILDGLAARGLHAVTASALLAP